MNEERLKELFAEQAAPDEDETMERGWRVASAGFEEAPSAAPHRMRPLRRLAMSGAAACVLVGAAFTPPGEAVTDWVSDTIRPEPETAAPPLRLPADGRLLVNTASGPWIVQQDGSKRLLGRYEDSSWSPGGLFVVATRGRQLAALEPGGLVRWTVDADQPVSGARWAPSGYRIAYLTGGRTKSLRVVAGDGTGDELAASRTAEVAPAWRPGLRHVLAYSSARGEIVLVDTDTGKELWRAAAGPRVRQLAWSADGQRLVALGRTSLRIFDAQGQLLSTLPTRSLEPQSAPTYLREVAFARRGHRLALIRVTPSRAGTEVVTFAAERQAGTPRSVFSAPGAIGEIEWSPDGEWLLVAWAGADQWVFVRAGSGREVRTVTGLADRFDAGSGPELPSVSAWCCASVLVR